MPSLPSAVDQQWQLTSLSHRHVHIVGHDHLQEARSKANNFVHLKRKTRSSCSSRYSLTARPSSRPVEWVSHSGLHRAASQPTDCCKGPRVGKTWTTCGANGIYFSIERERARDEQSARELPIAATAKGKRSRTRRCGGKDSSHQSAGLTARSSRQACEHVFPDPQRESGLGSRAAAVYGKSPRALSPG